MAGLVLTREEEAQLSEMTGGGNQGSPQAGDGSGFDDNEVLYSTEGLDSNDVERGGNVEKEGNYHFTIDEVKFGTSKNKGTLFLELKLTVLHSIDGQSPEGSRLVSTHYITERTRPLVSLLGCRIGVLKAVPNGQKNHIGQPKFDYVDAKTGATDVTKKCWLSAANSQFVGLVRYQPAEETFKEKWEIVNDKCWPVDAEQVADVPKNLQAMKLIGKKNFVKPTPAAPAGGTAKAPPANATKTTAPKPPAGPANVPDDLSDL